MKRDLYNALLKWKTDVLRMPLIIRGARQVGKSWLIQQFGKNEFENFIEINFEKENQAKTLFEGNISIVDILNKIKLYKKAKIEFGKTLLFLDEIQESENALKALRYFKEECPELHVIAAGSLLDFTLEKIGLPVGRVEFLYLYPLSFAEFLSSENRDDLRAYLLTKDNDKLIHHEIKNLFNNYLVTGGMPAVVQTWLTTKDLRQCQRMQDRIIQSFQDDFNKYAKLRQIELVEKVFSSVPRQLGSKFIYQHVDHDQKTYALKQALDLLVKAGVIHLCYHSSAQGLPLAADIDLKKFKCFFFDIGLMQRLLGLDLKEWVTKTLNVQYLGAVAEQFVAQEYIAYQPHHRKAELFYWQREITGSSAEVDFIFLKNNRIIPTEVKANIKGGMKSLKLFLDSHPHSSHGLKLALGQFSKVDHFWEIPIYALEAWLANAEID